MDNASYLNELFGMNGQVAVVIGGAGALGLCLSTGLGKNGAKIVAEGADEEAAAAGVEKVLKENL